MKKDKGITLTLIIIFIVGLSLLLYPSASDYINKQNQTKAIASYVDIIDQLDENDFEKLKNEAIEYNKSLTTRVNEYILSDEQQLLYEKMLDIDKSGIMGYVEIPKIEVSLPIYHGCNDEVLRVGTGHLEWTSLPVGGESTHCVLSGHRGLPSARLFTDLDRLEVGDVFLLHVLDEVLTYEIDQILIVKPADTEALKVVNGEDYCTLMTCTPYGINTHRINVRGKRIETVNEAGKTSVTSEAVKIEPLIIAPFAAIPLLLLLLLGFMIHDRHRTRGE